MAHSIHTHGFKIKASDHKFQYQDKLTPKLDSDTSDFDQDRLNEIVLWKVNRYAQFDEETIGLINSIDLDSKELDEDHTRKVLMKVLSTKGVRLPMASTILRFRNPKIYQIIDQRVYRMIYPDQVLKSSPADNDKSRKSQINLYLDYLKDLKILCVRLGIKFKDSDRILYMADKRVNKKISLDNYGSKKTEPYE